jgi:hypothetical protein
MRADVLGGGDYTAEEAFWLNPAGSSIPTSRPARSTTGRDLGLSPATAS